MTNCSECGATFPETQFVCEYCGHVETERVLTVGNNETIIVSFSQKLDKIKKLLVSFTNISAPTVLETISKSVRFFIILQTLGIAKAFWPVPVAKFNRTRYKSLKTEIKNNMDLLKIKSEGSSGLLDQIKVAEVEFHHLDKKIKKGINAARVTALVSIVLYAFLYYALINLYLSKK